jgi:outer membrane lipoprotein-sorting protein
MISGARSLAFVLLAFSAHAQTWELPALMQEMARVPASRARFVEVRHMALLTQPLELKGSLTYERPHRLAKHVQSPVDELLSVDGDTLTVLDQAKGEKRVIPLREQPAAGALVASVRATLAGDLAELERHYQVKLSGTRAAWNLRLVPREAQVRRAVDSIALAGAGARLDRLEVLEGNGDRSVMTILHDGK